MVSAPLGSELTLGLPLGLGFSICKMGSGRQSPLGVPRPGSSTRPGTRPSCSPQGPPRRSPELVGEMATVPHLPVLQPRLEPPSLATCPAALPALTKPLSMIRHRLFSVSRSLVKWNCTRREFRNSGTRVVCGEAASAPAPPTPWPPPTYLGQVGPVWGPPPPPGSCLSHRPAPSHRALAHVVP